jgi:xanthine dehydrogenase accessory factor
MSDIPRIIELLAKGDIFCLATVIASGDAQVPTGRKALVLSDGTLEGGFGSSPLDAQVRVLAMEALAARKRRTATVGDAVRVFLDILSAEASLLVCGAGHIAVPLARFARAVGFRVTVLDDRADFAHPSRFPGCEVIAEDFSAALRGMPLGPAVSVVVITRGHQHDVDCLEEILPKETAYVGLIGSRRRVYFVLDLLKTRGISEDRLRDLFTPIGLPLGAETPEEIALAIAAELVCVRRAGPAQAQALRAAAGGAK